MDPGIHTASPASRSPWPPGSSTRSESRRASWPTATDVGTGFRLVLDTGTFHGLTAAQREAMGREVSAVAAPDATVLLIAWAPKRRGPLPRGVSRGEVEAAFPGWDVIDVGDSGFEAPKPVELLMKPEERWYRLRQRDEFGAPPGRGYAR